MSRDLSNWPQFLAEWLDNRHRYDPYFDVVCWNLAWLTLGVPGFRADEKHLKEISGWISS